MNYRKVYMAIIAKAIKENRKKSSKDAENYVYYEEHHILPKSLFPAWKSRKSNKVLLTAREHYFCHQLLAKIYGKKMVNALWFLTIHNKTLKISSKDYEKARLTFSSQQSEKMKGNIAPNKGKKMSEEQKKKLSVAHKGKSAWNKGKHGIYSEETIDKIKVARERQTLEGRTNKGCKWSSESKKSFSEKQLGCKYYNNGIITIRCKPEDVPNGFSLGILRKEK